MITPQEKAAQLVVDNQLKVKSLDYKEAVQCAIVTVDEIIKEVINQKVPIYNYDKAMDYWEQVKQILEKL